MEVLDRAQRDAVCCRAKYILVAAPPGSGKTGVLASRFARLLNEGLAISRLAALTFTEKAAAEMSARVARVTGQDMGGAFIGTFHSLCLGILKKRDPALRVLGRVEQLEVLGALGLKGKKAGRAAAGISFFKNTAHGRGEPADEIADIYNRYEGYLSERGALDLDDLIREGTRALEDGGTDGLGFAHVMVDEYQDINAAQARLLRVLAGEQGHVFAIGDPDQAIYSFRGASLGFFLSFSSDWPGAVVKNLGTNYRSASSIVRASQSLIRHNKKRFDFSSVPVRPGGRVRLVECETEAGISSCIIKEIETEMGGLTSLTAEVKTSSLRFSDFAVLFRTRSSARGLVEAFRASNLPFHLVSPTGPALSEFLERLQGRGLKEGLTLAELITRESHAADLGEGLREMLLWLGAKYGDGKTLNCLEIFIEEARVLVDTEVPEVVAERVNLMTLHGAKGLEFKRVFIAGLEEGLIPLQREDSSTEEERRLFYVGLTRAAEEVVLLRAKKRRLYGKVLETRPSPFVEELGDVLIKSTYSAPKKHIRRAVQKGLFD